MENGDFLLLGKVFTPNNELALNNTILRFIRSQRVITHNSLFV